MNNAVSYAIDSQVIFNTFFSIMAIVVAIGVSFFIFVSFISKTILLLPHFMLCLYTIVPFFMAIF